MTIEQRLTLDEKLASAIAWLRERGKYILDQGSPAPNWGLRYTGTPLYFERVFFREFPEVCDEVFEPISFTIERKRA